MEKRERKPGYFARLKKRRQLKQSVSEKNVHEQSPAHPLSKVPVISCPDAPGGGGGGDPKDRVAKSAERQQRKAAKPPTDSVEFTVSEHPHMVPNSPVKPLPLTVGTDDTLNSIALHFNITPNKLVQLNKLFSRSVYIGQKLFVPDLSQLEAEPLPQPSENGSQVEGVSASRPERPIQRHVSPTSEDESPATVKFIKMSCKYFTDGMGVVGGVLIVTPNNIMFDPHKSDPLVIEHGCEEYGLICPMEEVVSVALYDDVSRMKLKDAPPSDLPQDLCPVYRPGEWEQLPSLQDLNPFSRYQALEAKRPIFLHDIDSHCVSEQVDKTPSDEGFTELEATVNGGDEDPDLPGPPEGTVSEGCQGPAALPPPSNADQDPEKCRTTAGKPTGKEAGEDEGAAPSGPAGDVESRRGASGELVGIKDSTAAPWTGSQEFVSVDMVSGEAQERSDRAPSLKDSGAGNRSPGGLREKPPHSEASGLSEEERRKKTYEAEVKTWLLERMQAPIQDMLLSSEEKSKNPPMFLCFKLGKPMKKSFAVAMNSSPAHTYGGRGKQPEYWFAVPQERVDHLYAFFVQWSPDVYGKEAREQGFVVVDELDMIITIDEAKRRQSFSSLEADLSVDALPVLGESSALLQDTHVEKLACRLPARVQGYPWRLAYSSQNHGTSLKTLYRSLLEVDSPVLLVLKDLDDQVFGAFSTHPFRVSEHYYGTGETFLYSFCPEIKVYRWTGDNSYFVKGNIDSLQFGGGGGQLGLWLDAELYRGTTSGCATFNNLALSAQQDFNIHSVEVWSFE
ncbi:hypothetical protein NHX12_026501 [Muraenolepis orangiensis]|uniref:Nuclear receptor coactivator 7 n=1 Tax=Muraenolepis orangiensis TaxID=630683 RepID=A0A9Q0IRY1_9TELE|nr:hypothetical protein NHX12_026501 [Muraenolepis orangiensis]